MSAFIVLFDASVLYPAPLRDLLMNLALTDLFRAKWTNQIHEEWTRNVLKDRPDLTRERIERTRRLMDENVRDSLVTNYEALVPALTLPDPDDRHILAAAIRCGASVIVTHNLRHFPAGVLSAWGIEAQHSDTFVSNLLSLNEASVIDAVKRQRENLKNPPQSATELLDTLERQGLAQTVLRLREFESRI